MELSKVIGKMYHALSEQKKTKYLEMAKKETQAYQEKMKKFMYISRKLKWNQFNIYFLC